MTLNRDNLDFINARRLTPALKALLVLMSAIIGGFMWRVRGTHGWGSMWGMFAVGVMLTLVIFAFYGNRRKMSLEALPIAVILLGITNGGWGTLNSQMGGYLGSTVPFTGEEAVSVIEISPWSGMAAMLLLGFGWMPLYSMFIGSLFSKKDYKIWHYITLIAVFYVVVYAFEFTVAHYIAPHINAPAVEAFKEGLADRGFDYSPMMAFIKNLGSEAWFKKIPFGRNYYATIRIISYSAGALVLSLATLVAKKDKVTAFISFAVNVISAVSITLADIVMVFDSDRGFFRKLNAPEFLKGGNWSLWEYLTGFFLFFGILLLIVCLPKKITGGEGYFEYKMPMKNAKLYTAYSAIMTLLATFVVTTARPAGMRVAEWVVYKGWFDDEDILTYIFIGIICAAGLIFTAVIAKKNIIKKELPNLFAVRTEDFCLKAMPVYFAVTAFIYFCTGDNNILSLPYAQMKSPSSIFALIRDGSILIPAIMLVSIVLFYALYGIISKKAVRKK
ncbi:MAG: hypothetical protein IJE74_08315 [Clostridia bacterium]|nr:hypothetical protein [Clostridia bacterium]